MASKANELIELARIDLHNAILRIAEASRLVEDPQLQDCLEAHRRQLRGESDWLKVHAQRCDVQEKAKPLIAAGY
jgi:hypothetical protein